MGACSMLDQTKCVAISDYFFTESDNNHDEILKKYYSDNQLIDAERLMRQFVLTLKDYQLLKGICYFNEEKADVNLILLKEDAICLDHIKTRKDWREFYLQFCIHQQKELLTYHNSRFTDSPFYAIQSDNYNHISSKEGVLIYFNQNPSILSHELQKLVIKQKIKVLN